MRGRAETATEEMNMNRAVVKKLVNGFSVCALGIFLGFAARAQSQPQTHLKNSQTAKSHKPVVIKPRADVTAYKAKVEKILSAPEAQRGYWGLLVEDADTGEVFYAENADHYFAPASNAKLFTTALALASLGGDYRFHTTLETRGTLSEDGVLDGDLVLVGRGDPNLSNRVMPYAGKTDRDGPPEKILAELADALAAKGVKQISGNVIGDDSYFAGGEYPSGWSIDDMLWAYGAPVSALEINDGTLFVDVTPGAEIGTGVTYTVEPWAGDLLQIRNFAITSARGAKPELSMDREPGSDRLVLGGSVPEDAQTRSSGIAIDHPAEYAAALLKQLLEARGVQVNGKAMGRHAPLGPAPLAAATVDEEAAAATPTASADTTPATVLAEHVSLPLSDAIIVVNKVSQNLHAEMLLRDAAREKTGDISADAALKFAEDFRTSLGLTEDDVVLTDACGLSRRDLVTPEAVAKLLRWAAQQPWAATYRDSLPVAGVDGTLSDRMKSTPAEGKIDAKTGTLGHVDSLSGYATSVRGEHLVFAFFLNNHTMKSKPAEDLLDALAVAMVETFGKAPVAHHKSPAN
jgi:serine-type D-Ala-D-Ala carboxypeptidase/endopeptidase (penicillin-binding protein 4)